MEASHADETGRYAVQYWYNVAKGIVQTDEDLED